MDRDIEEVVVAVILVACLMGVSAFLRYQLGWSVEEVTHIYLVALSCRILVMVDRR